MPSVYVHTASPLSQGKLGHAQQHAQPPSVQNLPQQGAVALQDEPLLKQAKQAYAGDHIQNALWLTYHH